MVVFIRQTKKDYIDSLSEKEGTQYEAGAFTYNNTCSFCIFIGRELCVIKVHTHG